MNKDRERIIEKIKRLLAVTEERGATQNEAIAAALQAQRLIAQNDVNDFELFGEEAPELVTVTSEWAREKSWRGLLARVIAENFRCKNYISFREYWWNGRKRRETCRAFYGYDMDASAALLTFEKLVKIGERLAGAEARKARNLYGTAVGVENNFLLGFVDGVREELEKQSQALLVVTPREVVDGFSEIQSGFTGKKGRPMSVKGDYLGMRDKGHAAGRDSVQASRLNQSDSAFALTA